MIDIREAKVIIAPSIMHPYLRDEMCGDKGCMGIDILSLNNYIKAFIYEDDISEFALMYEFLHKINTIKQHIKIYDKCYSSYNFLLECHHFIEQLKAESLTPDCLSEIDAESIEMKMIITTLYDIPSKQDLINQAIERIKNIDAKGIVIYPSYYTIEENEIINSLINNGARMMESSYENQIKDCYYGLNKKEEIEGFAQWLIENDINADEVQITLADNSYVPLIKNIFNRYQIPFSILSIDVKSSACASRFIALIDYYLNPSMRAIEACLNSEVFNLNHKSSLQTYLSIFKPSYEDIFKPFNHMQEYNGNSQLVRDSDIESLKKIETTSEEARIELVEKLEAIHATKSYEELILLMIHYVEHSIKGNNDGNGVLDATIKLLQDVFMYIKSDEDLAFLLVMLGNVVCHVENEKLEGIAITSLRQGSMGRDYQWLMGVDEKHFPAFPNKNGIFDEEFYAKTPLRSLNERYQYDQKMLHKSLKYNKYLYASYAIADYDGKGKEISLAIEKLFPKDVSFKIMENEYHEQLKHKIDSDSAKKLYLKDGKIKGSVSSLEKYVNCPYAYFLKYGLKIKDPVQLGFSDTYVGSLMHRIMELLIKNYHKKYVEVDEVIIEEIIDQEIEYLVKIYPNDASKLNVLKRRVVDNLKQVLVRLADYEATSLSKPFEAEQKFEQEFDLENIPICLNGVIDRIDNLGSAKVILDYKSSSKKIDLDKFKKGQQLQLILYAVMLHIYYHEDVLGAYYVSLKNENVASDAFKIVRTGKEKGVYDIDDSQLLTDVIKKHKLDGIAFDQHIVDIDGSGTHVKGICNTKTSGLKVKAVYNLDDMADKLMRILNEITSKIIQGECEVEPSNGACTYCHYHPICHFSGKYFEKEALIDEEIKEVE